MAKADRSQPDAATGGYDAAISAAMEPAVHTARLVKAELEIKRLRSALAAVTCELADCYRLIGVLDGGQAVPGAMCLLRDLRRCRSGR